MEQLAGFTFRCAEDVGQGMDALARFGYAGRTNGFHGLSLERRIPPKSTAAGVLA